MLSAALATGWELDWLWGLPLLVATVVFHVSAFLAMERALIFRVHHRGKRFPLAHFIGPIATTALGAAALHAVEAGAWAALYVRLGALSDHGTAMLYSLNAITSYGHENVFLESQWRLLGAIEAMNGLILFGLTTAFLFAAIQVLRQGRTG